MTQTSLGEVISLSGTPHVGTCHVNLVQLGCAHNFTSNGPSWTELQNKFGGWESVLEVAARGSSHGPKAEERMPI